MTLAQLLQSIDRFHSLATMQELFAQLTHKGAVKLNFQTINNTALLSFYNYRHQKRNKTPRYIN